VKRSATKLDEDLGGVQSSVVDMSTISTGKRPRGTDVLLRVAKEVSSVDRSQEASRGDLQGRVRPLQARVASPRTRHRISNVAFSLATRELDEVEPRDKGQLELRLLLESQMFQIPARSTLVRISGETRR
jgi:hypothetical protein